MHRIFFCIPVTVFPVQKPLIRFLLQLWINFGGLAQTHMVYASQFKVVILVNFWCYYFGKNLWSGEKGGK